MTKTSIEWTGYSSNPVKFRIGDRLANACAKCSPGCANCYAETLTRRFWPKGEKFPGYTPALIERGTVVMDDDEMYRLITSKAIRGKRVFVGDMTDIFGDWVSFDLLNRLFSTIEHRTDVTFQILTKRAKRMSDYLSWRWGGGRIPSRHIWLGVSCEDQARADERIPHLLRCPAAVRFVSAEPLLSDVRIFDADDENYEAWVRSRLHWLIVGGESGPNARPCNVEWIRSIVEQCGAASVPVFCKQLGSKPYHKGEFSTTVPAYSRPPEFHGEMKLNDRKGGDPSEWPADLRVRQMPATEAAR